MNDPHHRPPTPQTLIHASPLNQPTTLPQKPSKYLIILLAPTSIAGKLQIATSLSTTLSTPLYQGDSLHESSFKASTTSPSSPSSPNHSRYARMWMRKMIRTGLLFPEESRPANYSYESESEKSGRGRRGSDSSGVDSGIDVQSPPPRKEFVNKPVFALSEGEREKRDNPALMVLTHPELEGWCRDVIRTAVGEYGIGVIFVPLFVDGDVPLLKPFEARGFESFDALRAAGLRYGKGKEGRLDEEILLEIGVEGSVDEIIEEIVVGVRDVMTS